MNIYWEWNITFLLNKKILNLCLRWHILRSYCFAVEVTFQACVRYFLFYFIFFHLMIGLQKLRKTLFIWSKSSFHSRDIQIFVLPSSPLFLPIGHCYRRWSKIYLKVYDVINSKNKKLVTHFVWYLKNEKRYGIENLSIDRVLNKKHFYGKIIQEMCTKSLSQTSF